MLEGNMVTRDDLRDYFLYPPVEENEILRSLELTPEDVKGIGLHEKDQELFKEQSGQLLLYQVIKHLAILKYLLPRFQEDRPGEIEESIKNYRESLMIDAMEADLAKVSPDVSQEEMLAYYVENPNEFYRQGKRYARHIMLYENNTGDTPDNPFTVTPEQIWNRLENGEDFYSLIIETRSENSTQEGVLGWLPRGTIHQTFEKAMWALEIGEITGPIEINSTVHFIQLMDEQSEGLIPFDECRPRIKTILKEKKRTQHRYKLLGLNPDSLTVDNGELTEEYRQAILEAAYAREWHKNIEIVRRTEAFARYRKANLAFLDEIKRHRKSAVTRKEDEFSWILENKTATSLLNEMGFRLLIKLDIPQTGILDRDYQNEE